MTHLRRNLAHSGSPLAIALLAVCVGVSGCGKKEEKKPQQAYVPPPPAPVSPLEDLEMDPRVQFPESREPSTRALAEGIAQLASSIVSGDQASMKEVLDSNGKAVLDTLVKSGAWGREKGQIEAVRVCVLKEGEGGGTCELGLGVQDSDGAYLLAWAGQREGEAWVFSPSPLRYIQGEQLAALDDATLAAPALPAPVVLNVDPSTVNRKPMDKFSK